MAVYVSGLMVGDTQVYTNTTDTSLTQTNWDVTYAMVTLPGTNVVALFAARPNTTMKWLTDTFTIAGVTDHDTFKYATYEEAYNDDWDGDTFSNGDEAIAGTSPTNALDYLKISGITVDADGKVVVTFEGSDEGTTVDYELMEADLVGGPYSNVADRAKADGALSVTNTPVSSPKFYKIVVPYAGE